MKSQLTERGAVAPSHVLVIALLIVTIAFSAYSIMYSPKPPSSTVKPLDSAATVTPSALATHATRPSPTPSKPPSPTAAPVNRADFTVAIYNNSGVEGLAGRVATTAQQLGWKVPTTSQWAGGQSTSGVYYPPGMKDAAEQLAKDLKISSVKPAEPTMLGNVLTVVITNSP